MSVFVLLYKFYSQLKKTRVFSALVTPSFFRKAKFVELHLYLAEKREAGLKTWSETVTNTKYHCNYKIDVRVL